MGGVVGGTWGEMLAGRYMEGSRRKKSKLKGPMVAITLAYFGTEKNQIAWRVNE